MNTYKIKVVREVEGKYVSAMPTAGSLTYPLRKWVQPKFGKLFVFDGIEEADNFIDANRRLVEALVGDKPIFKMFFCEVLNPQTKLTVSRWTYDGWRAQGRNKAILPVEHLVKFWDEPNFDFNCVFEKTTTVVDYLKLVQEIN